MKYKVEISPALAPTFSMNIEVNEPYDHTSIEHLEDYFLFLFKAYRVLIYQGEGE